MVGKERKLLRLEFVGKGKERLIAIAGTGTANAANDYFSANTSHSCRISILPEHAGPRPLAVSAEHMQVQAWWYGYSVRRIFGLAVLEMLQRPPVAPLT